MAWPYTTEVDWGHGEEPSKFDNQPMDADQIIYAGCPAGLRAGSNPANCIRPLVAGDAFAGFAERTADNTVASAAAPNLLNRQNFGDGTTGPNGAKVRLRVMGLVRFDQRVPDGTGAAGTITGLVGTQADVGVAVYYNGTGFTTTSAGGVKVGTIAAYTTTLFGTRGWDLRLLSDEIRNS